MTQRTQKYKIIAAVSTLFIQLAIFAVLNTNFAGWTMLSPPKPENEEFFDIPLDQIVEDLSSIEEPSAEKRAEEAEQKPDLNKQDQPEAPVFNETTSPETTEQAENIIKEEEPLKAIPPTIEKEKMVFKDTIQLSIPPEIKNLLADQTITKNVNKQKRDANYAERIKFYRDNYRAIRNLIKVYPYAIRTREIMDSLNVRLTNVKSEPEKKRLINETEKMLFKQYETAVRTMSVSQGKVLLKLIARETNKTGYDIIKEYKGGFSAGFWYSVGKIFKTDLKTEYHAEKEDSVYEVILQKYKDGEFK
jgi:hypothetical protein